MFLPNRPRSGIFAANLNSINDKNNVTMKKSLQMILMAAAIAAASCSTDDNDLFEEWGAMPGQDNMMPGGTNDSNGSASIGDLTSFDIQLNEETLTESETIPADDEDYIENNTFDNSIAIVYNGTSATVSGDVDGVEVSVNGAHVTVNSTVKCAYELSGNSSDGSFKLYSEKKYSVVMNNLTLTNPAGPAINSQSGKRGYYVMADGTTNTLTDGSSYTAQGDEDMKGTLFSEGEILFSGKGKLTVQGNCKAGICSDDYILTRPGNNIYVKVTKGHGLKANDAVIVRGGVLNIEASGTAAKGIKTDGYVDISGGRTTVLTTGGGEYDSDEQDVSASAGVKCDSIFTMNGGELYIKSTGQGGKGISSDQSVTINDGTVKIITTGKTYTYGSNDSKAKGIKADGDLTVNGGAVAVRATGGEGSEGIESKGTMSINAGTVEVYAYDDALNAKKALNISGGYVFAYATNNDGIDSNGVLNISGGTVIGCGTTQPEDGFDCDQNTFSITGGTVIGIGGGTSLPSSTTTTQPVAVVGGSNLSSGTYLTLSSGDNTLLVFKTPRSYQAYTVVISTPAMKKGSTCTLTSGATVSGGTDFDGLLSGATVTGGTTLASLSLSSMVTTQNYSAMGGGGGMPGGGGHGGR